MRPLSGYPQPIGASVLSIFPHAGPKSYTQVTATAGTVPVTGGDTVEARSAGLKYFDAVIGSMTDDGAFTVIAIPVSKSDKGGAASATFRLKWIANVSALVGGQMQTAGSEAVTATDLSAEIVRLTVIGPK
jgi:hypothetical protein